MRYDHDACLACLLAGTFLQFIYWEGLVLSQTKIESFK